MVSIPNPDKETWIDGLKLWKFNLAPITVLPVFFLIFYLFLVAVIHKKI
jgi:hypothetical protein